MCQVAWKLGKTPREWQTNVIIPIFKKGDRKQCTNYRGISLLSLPGKVYAKCLERKCREIVESKLEDSQCGFRPGRSTTDQIFTRFKVIALYIFVYEFVKFAGKNLRTSNAKRRGNPDNQLQHQLILSFMSGEGRL